MKQESLFLCPIIFSVKESVEVLIKGKKAINDNMSYSIPEIALKFLTTAERVITCR